MQTRVRKNRDKKKRQCVQTKTVCACRKQTVLPFFDVLLTVHISIILVIDQLNAQILFCNKFIIFLYMFRALLCSSPGGQNCIIQHLISSHSVGGRSVHRLRASPLPTCAPDGHLQSVTIPDAV